jgi:hypothetical protein
MIGSSRKYTGTGRYREQLLKHHSKDSASKRNNEQISAKQRKQSPDSRDSPQNGRKSLPATHLIRD